MSFSRMLQYKGQGEKKKEGGKGRKEKKNNNVNGDESFKHGVIW